MTSAESMEIVGDASGMKTKGTSGSIEVLIGQLALWMVGSQPPILCLSCTHVDLGRLCYYRIFYCSLPNFGRSRQEQLCRIDARQPSTRPDTTSRPIRSSADCRLFLSGSARIGKTAIHVHWCSGRLHANSTLASTVLYRAVHLKTRRFSVWQ